MVKKSIYPNHSGKGNPIIHNGRTCGVTIAQEDVGQPLGDDGLLVHQVPNALQHCLKIVLLQPEQRSSS